MRIHISIIVFGLLFLGAVPASAQVNAASCSSTDVQAAINSATAGQTVNVPSGNCTWTVPVTLCQSLTLSGAGSGDTNITVDVGSGFGNDGIYVSGCSGKQIRITGFTFHNESSDSFGMLMFTGGTGLSLRVDHNTFDQAGQYGRFISFRVPVISPGVVIDHNTVTDQGSLVENIQSTETNPGDAAWTQAMAFGAINAVYFENNTMTYPSYATNPVDIDCDDGGKYVFRYNTESGNTVGNHGYDSVANGCTEEDVYNNTLSANNVAPFAIQYRGGTGVVYNNLVTGTATEVQFGVTDYRSASGGFTIHGICDGTNSVDQNTPPTATNFGWACHEQIGRGVNQASYPLYEWNNCTASLGCAPAAANQVAISVYQNYGGTNYTAAHIEANRDYYDAVANYNGTAGVGQGTLAQRPSTCTPSVAYWATDTNTLYQCSSADVWNAYYTPYQYPHPLEGASAVAPATGLIASSQ